LQAANSQPAMKRSQDLSIPVSHAGRLVLAAALKEQSLMGKAADTLFRNWGWTLALWGLATMATAGYAVLSPREYQSEMTFLVNNNRSDSQSSSDGNGSASRAGDISDQQMATEIQILSSRDLSVKALGAAGFHGGTPADQERALRKLQKNLLVAPVLKANIIRVRYSAPTAEEALRVLETLAKAYPEQHVRLHSNPAEMGFFDEQSADAQGKLKDAENKLLSFQQETGVVNVTEQKQLLLSRQIELQVALHQAEAERREASTRIDSITPRLSAMPIRIATQTRRLPNQYSVERMSTMLTELQNRRTELLSKYRPGERIVTQLDQQIADTKNALQTAEGSVATEEVSDVNLLRQGLEADLQRAQATEAGLVGRIQAMQGQNASYQAQLAKLETLAPLEEQYQRDAKVAESNYLLYAKKGEEARISQRMDDRKLANVVLAERPLLPVFPKSRALVVIPLYILSLLLCAFVVAMISRMRQTVETPWALEELCEVPVLGTVPDQIFKPYRERLRN